MGDPSQSLPTVSLTDIRSLLDEINLPHYKTIEILPTSAQYHIIALLKPAPENKDKDLILRISGPHIPHLKTQNEVAVLSYLQNNTSIPVPEIIHHDAGSNNPLGCEYIIQRRVPGQSLEMLWPTLSEDERLNILDFAADVLHQLHAHEWKHIGSVRQMDEENGTFVPGALLDERFWDQPDIDRYFHGETYESLNPVGPYTSYVEYSVARIQKYVYCIQQHESLAFMREHIPLIENFVAIVQDSSDELNKGVKLCLAHRDLHMGNIMYSTSDKTVTGILDWEFSVVMPLQQGDLSRAFMHDLQDGGSWPERKKQRLNMIRRRREEKGLEDVIGEYDYVSGDQEEMQEAVDLLRAIVEVSPRGQKEVEKMDWMRDLLEIMEGWMEEG